MSTNRSRVRYEHVEGVYTSIGTPPPGGGHTGWYDNKIMSGTFKRATFDDEVVAGHGYKNCVHHHFTLKDPGAFRVTGKYFGCNVSISLTKINPRDLNPESLIYGDSSPGIELDYTSAMNKLIADACGSMPMSASLIVNIVEFRQLKGLVPGLLDSLKTILRSKIGRKSAKELANQHLAYSFGVAPVISDLKSFLNIRAKVEKRIVQLLKRNGKPFRITTKTPEVTGEFETTGVWAPNSSFTRLDMEHYHKYSASGRITGLVSAFYVPDSATMWKLWMSALGISSPLTNCWELIPFSFVVDWFIPIGNAFLSLEQKLGMHETARSCDVKILGYSSEVKVETTSKWRIDNSVIQDLSPTSGNGPRSESRTYSRFRRFPPTNLLEAPSNWTLSRSALGLSLLTQKFVK